MAAAVVTGCIAATFTNADAVIANTAAVRSGQGHGSDVVTNAILGTSSSFFFSPPGSGAPMPRRPSGRGRGWRKGVLGDHRAKKELGSKWLLEMVGLSRS